MIENHARHSLGHRAFLVFFARKLKVPIILFIISGAAWYAKRWVPADYSFWSDYAVHVFFLVSGAYLLLVFLLTYLSYRAHSYMFTEEAFIMMSGLAVRNEVAALYHQIQNVNINRSVLDRSIGVSEVVILMIGSDRGSDRAQIVLPAVGKMKARQVQKELLIRARGHMPAPVPVTTAAAVSDGEDEE